MDNLGAGKRVGNFGYMGRTADNDDFASRGRDAPNAIDDAFGTISCQSGIYKLIDDRPQLLLRLRPRLTTRSDLVDRCPNT